MSTARGATSIVDRAIGYVAADMGGRSVAEIVTLVAGAGYGAVDWTMEQFDPLRDSPQRLGELVEQARAAGLQVPQLMVHQDHVTLDADLWEQRVRRAECAVLACAHAEIDSIGVLSGPNPWEPGAARVGVDLSEAHAWELSLRALERVLDRAEEESVRVALEPCWGTLAHGRYRAEHLLAALDCAALAVNFDPSHHVLCGDDIPGAVRAWAEESRCRTVLAVALAMAQRAGVAVPPGVFELHKEARNSPALRLLLSETWPLVSEACDGFGLDYRLSTADRRRQRARLRVVHAASNHRIRARLRHAVVAPRRALTRVTRAA